MVNEGKKRHLIAFLTRTYILEKKIFWFEKKMRKNVKCSKNV